MSVVYQPSLALGGGPYATEDELSGALISNPEPTNGFLVYVTETDAYYKLSLTSGAPLSPTALKTTLGGNTRWLKMNLSGVVPPPPTTFRVSDYLQLEKSPNNGFPPNGQNTATSHPVLLPPGLSTGAKLVQLNCWSALPATDDSMYLELYLYRRLTEGDPFNYYLASDGFTFDSSQQWSYEIDLTNLLYDIVWAANDTLALRLVYNEGDGVASMSNFRVGWTWETTEFTP